MPRLSVDIDLTYLEFDDREMALAQISAKLEAIKRNISKNIHGIKIETSGINTEQIDKLLCTRNGTKIKIEVNTTMRGFIKQAQLKQITGAVQKNFEKFVAMQVVSMGELFGGKICAALDRQHPRDLFDIHQLFERAEFTEETKEGFIAALLSHNKPIHELLRPKFQNQERGFARQFEGMTFRPFSYQDFENTRIKLAKEIKQLLTKEDKEFLLSFKSGFPDWNLTSILQLDALPAIQWKLQNIKILLEQNPSKHKIMLQRLEEALL